jgi:hypothetical protein
MDTGKDLSRQRGHQDPFSDRRTRNLDARCFGREMSCWKESENVTLFFLSSKTSNQSYASSTFGRRDLAPHFRPFQINPPTSVHVTLLLSREINARDQQASRCRWDA